MVSQTPRTDWRTLLREQGRTLRWLALATGTKPRTVYAYSQESRTPSAEWIARALTVLGEEVAA